MKIKDDTTVVINNDDLQEYCGSYKDRTHPISTCLSLSSQLKVEGIKSLRDAILSSADLSLDIIKENHASQLLADLERATQKKDGIASSRQLPAFKAEFRNEATKPQAEQTAGYRSFIEAYAKLEPDTHYIESISAKALQDLSNSAINIEQFQTNFEKNLENYQQSYAEQTAKDLDRLMVCFKDQNGVTKDLTLEELSDPQKSGLTGEQIGFIKDTWQQGSFDGGWAMTLDPQQMSGKNNLIPVNELNRTDLFIDASNGSVRVMNNVTTQVREMNAKTGQMGEPRAYLTASISVDITEMQAERFVAGCASSSPKIEFQFTREDKDLDFVLPKDLKVREIPKDQALTLEIKAADMEAHIYAIENKTPSAARATKELENKFPLDSKDLTMHVEAVTSFCATAKDEQLKQGFVNKHLDGFLKAQDIAIVNDKVVTDLTKAITAIAAPVCTELQKKQLEQNAAKMIRKCAQEVDAKTSWTQTLAQFKDKFGGMVDNLRGKPSTFKSIMQQHPALATIIQNNFKQSAANAAPVMAAPNKARGYGR